MIDFHYWPTPNGWKVAILLEELGLPYRVRMVNIGEGDQFTPEFLTISPNGRMPAIVDHDVEGPPVPVFESGAIMLYLAEKTGRFLPKDPLGRKEAVEWLFWQTGNQGPMAGQHSHFFNYAPEPERKQGYGFKRYRRETIRCLDVLERRLDGRDWLAGGDYSVADMMCFPWALIMKAMEIPLDGHPRVSDWRGRVKDRPAVQRGVALGKESRPGAPHDAKARKILFGRE